VKVVFDTNVLISAYNFPGGASEDAFRLCLTGQIELVTSAPLLAEFTRVLRDKFGWSDDETRRAIAQVARIASVVEPVEHLTVITDDPDDDRILEAAAEASASLICSGDKHLLRLIEWRGIRTVSPSQLIELLDGQGD